MALKLEPVMVFAAALAAFPLLAPGQEELGDAPIAPIDPGAPPDEIDFEEGLTEMLPSSFTTDGSTYDPTALYQYIPAHNFVPYFGTPGGGGFLADYIVRETGGCIYPDDDSGGSQTNLYAPVKLPERARIKSVTYYLYDNSPEDISAYVNRTYLEYQTFLGIFPNPPTTSWNRTVNDNYGSGSTAGTPGWTAITVNVPDTNTGTVTGPGILQGTVRLFGLDVVMDNVGSGHRLCGARVYYDLPASGDNQAYTPVTPCQVFSTLEGAGRIAGGATRKVKVTGDNSPQGGTGDCGVPTNATAAEFTFTAINCSGQGNLKMWPPGVAEPRAIATYKSSPNLWNGAATIPIGTDAAFSGGKGMNVRPNPYACDLRIAVTGYYSPVSNMAN